MASALELERRLSRLEARRRGATPLLEEVQRDAGALMRRAGLVPDAWQERVLQATAMRLLLCCSRQSGKSTVAAALALAAALLEPGALVLLLSPTQRQSGELYRKVMDLFRALGRPATVAAESALRVEFASGSRIVALPGAEETVRSYSGVRLLVLDEASRVRDDLYRAVRPMLAVSGGRLIALSSPFGKRGFFYDEWVSDRPWQRVEVKATACPRITAEFLAEERQAIGERWYQQEYMCSFEEVVGAVFDESDLDAAFRSDCPMIAPGSW